MSAYVIVLIWILSALVCAWIGKIRHVRPRFFWNMVVAIFGPLAIPLVLLAKPRASRNAD